MDKVRRPPTEGGDFEERHVDQGRFKVQLSSNKQVSGDQTDGQICERIRVTEPMNRDVSLIPAIVPSTATMDRITLGMSMGQGSGFLLSQRPAADSDD